ncbi:MAG: YdcF family protein [Ruminococcus sp.]|nr:YdcF family protein [Ruminococcus sp.]
MTVRYVFLALEIMLLFLFLAPFPIICSGNVAGIVFSLALIFITANFKGTCALLGRLWGSLPGKISILAAALILAAGAVYVSVLSVKMYRAQENRPEKTKVIVVLGCKVNGEKPSRMLRRRLDAAAKALDEHPEAVCIVSGGQGSNEKISEAEAMKRYLLEKGIEEERLIMEDRSTSTYENLKYSFELTDEMGLGRDITIVTDGFHQYRASLIAKELGAGEITACSAYTEPRFLPTYWVREWLGLSYFFVFGK